MTDRWFWLGFAAGLSFAVLIVLVGCIAYSNAEYESSEILKVEYYNNTGLNVSRAMIENIVKTQFPSSTWENAKCESSKNRVKIKLSNP